VRNCERDRAGWQAIRRIDCLHSGSGEGGGRVEALYGRWTNVYDSGSGVDRVWATSAPGESRVSLAAGGRLWRRAGRCADRLPDHVRDHNGDREEHGDGKNGAEHGEMVAKEADQGRPG
jgi:hypothetical protein